MADETGEVNNYLLIYPSGGKKNLNDKTHEEAVEYAKREKEKWLDVKLIITTGIYRGSSIDI